MLHPSTARSTALWRPTVLAYRTWLIQPRIDDYTSARERVPTRRIPELRLLAATIPTLPNRDPAALVSLTLFLVLLALVACYVPAGRASRVAPLVALRHD